MERSTGSGLSLFQLAISTFDAQKSQSWYAEHFGYLRSGGMEPDKALAELKARGEMADGTDMEAIQGIPGAALSSVLWLVDRQEFFQLELMQYSNPVPKPRPAGWRPCDVGYTMVGLHVSDFDGVVASLLRSSTTFLGEPVGDRGNRRVCLYDPDGVLLELLEADVLTPGATPTPRPHLPVATRSVRLSVPDLSRSCRFFGEILELPASPPDALHTSNHEALWGLEGAQRNVAVFSAGDLWIELVQYLDPPGAPLPADYTLGDQGIFNIGLGTRSEATFVDVRDRVRDAGYVLNLEGVRDFFRMHYIVDDQQFSVQVNYNGEVLDGPLGFLPLE